MLERHLIPLDCLVKALFPAFPSRFSRPAAKPCNQGKPVKKGISDLCRGLRTYRISEWRRLEYRPMEQRLAPKTWNIRNRFHIVCRSNQRCNGVCPRRLPENCDIVRVSSERSDMPTNPTKSRFLVFKAEIRNTPLRMPDISLCPKTIGNLHHNDIPRLSQRRNIITMVFTPPCKVEPAVNPHHHRQPPMLLLIPQSLFSRRLRLFFRTDISHSLPRHSHGQARQQPMHFLRHSHGQAKFPLTHLQARIRSELPQQMRQILRTNAAIFPRIDNLPLPIFHHLRHPKPGITGINNPVEQTGTVPQLLPDESSPCHRCLNFKKIPQKTAPIPVGFVIQDPSNPESRFEASTQRNAR